MKRKKTGRPPRGKSRMTAYINSRIDLITKKKILKKFGTVRAFIDHAIKELL